MSTRILFATDVGSTPDTGMGRHQYYLARELRSLGFEVEEFYAEDVPARVPAVWRRFAFPWAVLRRARAAQSAGRPFEALIVHEGSAGFVALASRLGWIAARCIAVSHNPEQKVWEVNLELARRGRHSIPFKSRIAWPLTRLWQSNLALRCADMVVCLSREDFEFIRARYGRAEDCIAVLQNGVTREFFSPRCERAEPRLLFVGSWLRHKGVEALSTALRRVLMDYPQARVSLAGVSLAEAAVRQGFPEALQSRIHVESYVAPEALPGIFAAHNIFVLPSWYEGMPLSLLEAMAAGMAVVVSDVGGMRDVVEEGVSGIRVAPRDAEALGEALARLCGDPALRARMGEAARARAAGCTWQRAAELLAQIVRGLMHPQRAPAAGAERRASS